MVSPEFKSVDPMRQLKDAKFALNAGKPKQAYQLAQDALRNAREREIPRIEAMALHRLGSAYDALGLHTEAKRHMNLSVSILESLNAPDYLAQGIVERDLALLVAQADKSADGSAEAYEWQERATSSHNTANHLPSTKRSRITLELATTAAFGHRLQALENRYDHANLWDDVTTVRNLRGHTKPGYELDAIEWATRYEHDPLRITRALPRAAFLALQVGNPVTPVKLNSRPAIRFVSNQLER